MNERKSSRRQRNMVFRTTQANENVKFEREREKKSLSMPEMSKWHGIYFINFLFIFTVVRVQLLVFIRHAAIREFSSEWIVFFFSFSFRMKSELVVLQLAEWVFRLSTHFMESLVCVECHFNFLREKVWATVSRIKTINLMRTKTKKKKSSSRRMP